MYTVFTFAPVQGFIEKSRKLRDLYGASIILSYLTFRLTEKAEAAEGVQVISPGMPNVQEGMPNRIVLSGVVTVEEYQKAFFENWRRMLREVRDWIERQLPAYEYCWRDEWQHWGNHAWEFFWGQGASVPEAVNDLEARKLARSWTGINWTGESSSLSGTDAIAWPGLGRVVDVRSRKLNQEKQQIQLFYSELAKRLDPQGEGKFLAENEQLSIPELTKRLVTRHDLARSLGMTELEAGFTDLAREQDKGTWTGWLMGDGDKIGNYLKDLARSEDGGALRHFSEAMREWGRSFARDFAQEKLGRVIYAGGDDFLAVFYRPQKKLLPGEVIDWLCNFPKIWRQHGQKVTVSAGFVWAAPRVPQRDVLQHCREAEQLSKAAGRDRLTLRVVFNSGQYVQWTCPWEYLKTLMERRNQVDWTRLYKDLAELQARHAFEENHESADPRVALALFDIYFPRQGEYLNAHRTLVHKDKFSGQAINSWISDLIRVGWHLCSNT
ncbi:Cas10/Cmr2 second palm domain-containing protein [Gloeobacter kilaueensis]|uniref:Uncharacterized protein n=1 Tax=Gloeobacter kilaueensis (strain ATCC BAA-2537 / CCAP 1431/1 / ULC 316 / JS1) TaxID=1183438 RepID=U5QRQ1_GLOK1|nr:type III-B CRISPR-associated protein Cas10/Cmr2 [Gloeobacter kilaueensis]AGY60299.1 hypothetical protein GKIL_4053 [Gloeobacter kilaueensis JS1]